MHACQCEYAYVFLTEGLILVNLVNLVWVLDCLQVHACGRIGCTFMHISVCLFAHAVILSQALITVLDKVWLYAQLIMLSFKSWPFSAAMHYVAVLSA